MTIALVTRLIDEQIRLEESAREARGDLFGKSAFWENAQLLSPASKGQRQPGPKPTFVVGLALAEGLQLGLILAFLRRRPLAPKH
jgi:uncharacterized protein involved in exopolysaccharide biosynthesis